MAQKLPARAAEWGKWAALVAALLGWLFDGFEMGMFPLVGPNALEELLSSQSAVVKTQWFGVIMAVFLVGAATGGVLFGWLGDRMGRVRAMSLSIFTYAIFTGLCGVATQAWHIALLRFVASLGMGGEWALGVALVTELWPAQGRAFVAGLIGAASNVGFFGVGLLSLCLAKVNRGTGELLSRVGFSSDTVTALLAGEGWRLLMIAGALPALLVFFILTTVPESHRWQAERAKGGTSHWATRDLIAVLLGACGALSVIFFWSPKFEEIIRNSALAANSDAVISFWVVVLRGIGTGIGLLGALWGYVYPVRCYLARAELAGKLEVGARRRYEGRLILGACLAGVALLGTWGSVQWVFKWADALGRQLPPLPNGGSYHAKEYAMIVSASGAIIATIVAALVAGRFGRRITYSALCVLSFASLVYLYRANDAYGTKFLVSVFAAGGISASFYGWFPLYFPELFPTCIRATSQGFAFNFGRVLSAIGTLQTAALTSWFASGIAPERVGIDAFPKAGAALASIYLIGVLLVWLGPETHGKPLLE